MKNAILKDTATRSRKIIELINADLCGRLSIASLLGTK